MGCLKSIIKKIFFLAIIFAFFFFGGYDFMTEKYQQFTSPPREVLIKDSKNFGDFSKVSSDYRLTRSLNFGGYRKFNAHYLPTNQKITILDLKNNKIIEPKDFYTKEIDKKINELLLKFKDSAITLEELTITNRGVVVAKGKTIPYVNFKSKVKNIPFKTVEGTIAAYESQNIAKNKKNSTIKIVISMRDSNKYNQEITANFIKDIKFN